MVFFNQFMHETYYFHFHPPSCPFLIRESDSLQDKGVTIGNLKIGNGELKSALV